MDPTQLLAFFNSRPDFVQEWNRVRTQRGDPRSQVQWLQDHMAAYPEVQSQFQQYMSDPLRGASSNGNLSYELATRYFRENVPGGQEGFGTDAWNNRFNEWIGGIMSQYGVDRYEDLPATVLTSGTTPGTSTTVPLEEDLLGTIIDRGYADIGNDAQRRTDVNDMLNRLQPAYDRNVGLVNDIANGNLLAGEQAGLGVSTAAQLANLQEQLGLVRPAQEEETRRQLANLDVYRTGVSGNIDADIAARQAGLDPLKAQRLNAAGSAEAAVNLGVQDQLDQARAEAALQGFVGSSSSLDQQLARAAITGRQQAATIRGDANVANATDQYGLDTYGAGERRTLGDSYQTNLRGINDAAANTARLLAEYGAGEQRKIKDTDATGRFGLQLADNNRRIASIGLPTSLANDWINSRNAGDEYANAGINRLLNQLNWFGTGQAAPAVGAAPDAQPYDSGLGQLGSGIASLGTNLLMSQAWKNAMQPKMTILPASVGAGGMQS